MKRYFNTTHESQDCKPGGFNASSVCLSGVLAATMFIASSWTADAQINTGSDGHDGALNPTANMVINMADHPDGIYHYTSVNIPANVTITFISNAKNTPVVWLVAGNCTIKGTIDVNGESGSDRWGSSVAGGKGGPGGYSGGNGGEVVGCGLGPGGGSGGSFGESAAYGTLPDKSVNGTHQPYSNGSKIYGNQFLVPLVGGSGGGGSNHPNGSNIDRGGGGGGGAILIAAAGSIINDGWIYAYGGSGGQDGFSNVVGGGGSGGAIRLFCRSLSGSGYLFCGGGDGANGESGGKGRVRLDVLDNKFGGQIDAVASEGFQPIIIPSTGQSAQLTISQVGGFPVAPSPSGMTPTPDVVIAAQQANPIAIIVQCTGIPLNTPITVTIKSKNSPAISAVGYNSSGSFASSTATVSLNLPRGGGLIYATATTVK